MVLCCDGPGYQHQHHAHSAPVGDSVPDCDGASLAGCQKGNRPPRMGGPAVSGVCVWEAGRWGWFTGQCKELNVANKPTNW